MPAPLSPLIRLHPHDNVLIAREPLALGRALPEFDLRVRAQVPAGHKIAARALTLGERVIKYHTVIGAATRAIAAGEHVHSHNLALVDDYRDPAFGADVLPVAHVPEAERATFQGIVRADGRVGTRNFIGIFSSVNCSATVIPASLRTSRPSGWLNFLTSTVWWRLRRPAAAAWPRPASTLICCDARLPAPPRTPTSAPR